MSKLNNFFGNLDSSSLARDHLREIVLKISRIIILSVLAFIFLYPFVWMVLSSLKSNNEFFGAPWALPEKFMFENYITAWKKANLTRALFNSLIVSGFSVILILLASVPAAFAFARTKFRGKLLYMPILLCLALPIEALIIPIFYELKVFGLTDKLLGLIFVEGTVGIPFSIFILTEFFRGVPRSLEEAAVIDGANRWKLLLYIIIPLSKAAISAVVVLQFILIWNDFTLPLIIISKSELYTVPLAIQVFVGKYFFDYPHLFAALAVSSIPIIIIYARLQRQFVRGLTAGAVKE